MYYCSSDSSSWANYNDLVDRYGQEFVDKISTRNKWDAGSDSYVADESNVSRARVVGIALCDAKAYIKRKLTCAGYEGLDLLDTQNFPGLKLFHVLMTIEVLRLNGDCSGCACNADLDKFIGCGNICTDEGVCLTSSKTFISVSEAKFPCECDRGCSCC